MLSGTIMLPRAILMVVLGMAGVGEDTVQDGWECGVGGLEGGWIEKSGRLAEKTVGSEWDLTEMTAPIVVCSCV